MSVDNYYKIKLGRPADCFPFDSCNPASVVGAYSRAKEAANGWSAISIWRSIDAYPQCPIIGENPPEDAPALPEGWSVPTK